MSEEEKGKDIYTIGDNPKIDFEKSEHDFDIMPDEFFNSKYQQSRVKKEQQMQKEKEFIEKKKKEKVEKLSKLSELEKQRKEKDDLKKERERIRQDEKRKRQEEIDLVNKKREQQEEELKQQQEEEKKRRDDIQNRKIEKERKIRELNQKAKKERKLLKKEQEEMLKKELERRSEILKAQNSGTDEVVKNKEIEKALNIERAGILKKIKLEQKLNIKEQNRIRKEMKEEEKQKFEKERKEALAQEKLKIGKSHKMFLNLDFIFDNRLDKVNNKETKKRRIITYISFSVGFVVLLFVLFQTRVINFDKKQNNIEVAVTNKQPTLGNLPNTNKNNETTTEPSNNNAIPSNFDSVLNYNYKYKYSRFFDFFNFKVKDGVADNYLSTEEKKLYGTTDGVLDSDDDGHVDGEEVMNLYDPAKKTDGQSLDLRLTDSGKVVYYKFGNIGFYYPSEFVKPFNLQESVIVTPDVASKEYISFTILKNNQNVSFSNFLSLT